MEVLKNFFDGAKKIASTEIAVKDGRGKAVTLDSLPHGFQYSTEEQWTGRYWLDGKKIYTKSFTFSFTSNSYDINVSNLAIDQLFIKFDSSTMNTSSGAIYTLPRAAIIDNTGPNQIELNLSKSKIGIACGGSFSSWTKSGVLTIEYTCTNR